MDADPDWPPQKTVWRGVLHQHAAGAALAAGFMLVIGAPGGRAKAGCAVYAGGRTHALAFDAGRCCSPMLVMGQSDPGPATPYSRSSAGPA